MVNFFQILNQFLVLFRKNVIKESSMIWRVLPLVRTGTRISETTCIYIAINDSNLNTIIIDLLDSNSKNKLGDLKVTYKYDSHCAESNDSKNERFWQRGSYIFASHWIDFLTGIKWKDETLCVFHLKITFSDQW
jgi:hypothetical protein